MSVMDIFVYHSLSLLYMAKKLEKVYLTCTASKSCCYAGSYRYLAPLVVTSVYKEQLKRQLYLFHVQNFS